jgi:hypothetical protein
VRFHQQIFDIFLKENTVAIVMLLVRWIIPDVSGKLKDQIRRETYITNEIIIKQEAKRASRMNSAHSQKAWNKVLKTTSNMTGSQLDLYIDDSRQKDRYKFIEDEESQPINRISQADIHHNFIRQESLGTNV